MSLLLLLAALDEAPATDTPAVDQAAVEEAATDEAAEAPAEQAPAEEAVLIEHVEQAWTPTKVKNAELESSMPTFAALTTVVFDLQDKGNQITDMSVGVVHHDKAATNKHFFGEGNTVSFTVLGDPDRIEDMEVVLLDPSGEAVATAEAITSIDFGESDEGEPMPVPVVHRLNYKAVSSGYHEVQVRMKKGAEDWGVAYYSSVLSYASQSPIGISETLLTMLFAVTLAETEGLKVQAANWTTISEDNRAEIAIPVDTSFEECLAFGMASDSRVKTLDIDVAEPGGTLVAMDTKKKKDAVGGVDFSPTIAGDWRFGLTATKMQRGVSDSHAAVLMGCL